MLGTTGGRSGVPRTVPVLGLPTSEVSSDRVELRSGAPSGLVSQPAHDPRATVAVNGASHGVRAVEAIGDRRARIWPEGLKVNQGMSQYERRAPQRDIAVFVVEPVG
jgi:hypothetical protein